MKKLGGTDLERLFLEDSQWANKTDIPGVDMADLIARHKGRYALCGLFLRPGFRFLDFPCGSGYASELLAPWEPDYYGQDLDETSVIHAAQTYAKFGVFNVGDLMQPDLPALFFNTIACIEGLEHIEQKYQAPLISAFWKALKPGGTLIVSSPEAEVSGPNPDNPFHLWELSRADFAELLQDEFGDDLDWEVEIISHTATLSTGKKQTCLYAVCHK